MVVRTFLLHFFSKQLLLSIEPLLT